MAEFQAFEMVYDIEDNEPFLDPYVVVAPRQHWERHRTLLPTMIGRQIEGFPPWREVPEGGVFYPGTADSFKLRQTLNGLGCAELPGMIIELLRQKKAEAPPPAPVVLTAAERLLGKDIFGEDDDP